MQFFAKRWFCALEENLSSQPTNQIIFSMTSLLANLSVFYFKWQSYQTKTEKEQEYLKFMLCV